METYAELSHDIGVVMHNKCSTAEWAFWKKVSEDLKKSMLEELAWKNDFERYGEAPPAE
ncbi:hypothetical protein C1H46_018824 [Malus baccata]|uniref:Uncharacterized protein n=1 Tax=Malus baccata TaxID=106549 RepID=A0A540MA07_MALBA|nr:hypothetical protein C1H46_018824 [Malus baccata]